MEEYFIHNERLGIHLPALDFEWTDFPNEIQQSIIMHWEKIRGMIPDRILHLEKLINMKQVQLSDESDFKHSCRLNSEIAELASIINDLWLWFRTNQDITGKIHQ